MSKTNTTVKPQTRDDLSACLTIIAFVYSPLVLMLGAAAVISLG